MDSHSDFTARWLHISCILTHQSFRKLLSSSVNLMPFSLFGLISVRVWQNATQTHSHTEEFFACIAPAWVSVPCSRALWQWKLILYHRSNGRKLIDASSLLAWMAPWCTVGAWADAALPLLANNLAFSLLHLCTLMILNIKPTWNIVYFIEFQRRTTGLTPLFLPLFFI